MANLQQLVDELSKLTVLEAAELSKLLEEKWGVSAAAPVAVAAAPGAAAAAPAAREDRIHRRPDGRRRQEDQRDQGSPRDHRTWASRKPRTSSRRLPKSQGRCVQGRSREDQEAARRRWREGRAEIRRRGGCHKLTRIDAYPGFPGGQGPPGKSGLFVL